jgi:hypothetical protein
LNTSLSAAAAAVVEQVPAPQAAAVVGPGLIGLQLDFLFLQAHQLQ